MLKQCHNPYLPSWEYVPDGEPHVFGDRVYVYGSHDRFQGYAFCLNDYICWSAPVDDLSDWRYEGVIYKRTDDPKNPDGEMCLYAPDVTQGADGRYYLYYVLDQLSVVSVAVCDTPAGKYEFYGYVHYPDGTLLGSGEAEKGQHQFDPGVLYEDGKVYLYTGFCPKNISERVGAMATVLEPDMLTIKEAPVIVAPSLPHGAGTGYEGHTYFEAASIRKIGDTYYFVYSTNLHHELCYATSKNPTGKFTFRGTIVSAIDLGIDHYKPADMPINYNGNNHGGIENINGQWYIFYHRHTNGSSFCRQGCIEPITILEDGSIPQVEVTSSGAGRTLIGKGEYPSYIACHLFRQTDEVVPVRPGFWVESPLPRITQEGRDGDENPGFIENMRDGAIAGFKYFDCKDIRRITVKVRGGSAGTGGGKGGRMEVSLAWDGQLCGSVPVGGSNEWKEYSAEIAIPDGVHALYFKYVGDRSISFASFTLE